MSADEIRARREARGMSDPLNRLQARNAARIAAGEEIIVEHPYTFPEGMPCYCPSDCNCNFPHRTNYCGCKQHTAEVS